MIIAMVLSLIVPSRCPRCGADASIYGSCDCRSMGQWDASKHKRDASGHFAKSDGTSAHILTTGPVTDEHKAALMAAVAMLPEDVQANLPTLNLVKIGDDRRESDLRAAQNELAASVDPGGSTINVVAYSKTFLGAMKGDKADTATLAGQIVHEAWHVKNGPDEAGAYAAQIDALTAMKAPKSVIGRAKASRDQVVGGRR